MMRLFFAAALVFAPGLGAAGAEDDLGISGFGDEGFLSAPLGNALEPQPRSLSPDDVSVITRVEAYLNQFTTVRARFVQLSSDGNFAEGLVHLQRPGKMRFEYDPPTPVLLIADGNSLLYYDKELESATFVPLEETPLWFIMRPTVSLTHRTRITGIVEDAATLSVSLRDEDKGDAGEVTLVFSDQPMALEKWVVTDAQGISVQVALVNPEFDIPVDDELFEYGDLDVYGTRSGGPMR